MRTILLALLTTITACKASGGFSLNGGSTRSTSSGGGGVPSTNGAYPPTAGHAVVSDATTAAIAANGHPFDVNKDCYGEHPAIDFHRTPVLYWPCFDFAELPGTAEYSTFARNCDEVNEAFKGDASIACQIEHKGFDDHFAAQAKVPRNADRDPSDPGNYCGMIFGEFAGRHAIVTNTLGMLAKPTVRAEFLAKVKSISCVYDDAKGGTAELAGTDLRLYTSKTADQGWVFPAIQRTRAFPALEAFVQEYGTCQGGFSC